MCDKTEDHRHFLEIGENVGYDDAVREFFILVKHHGDGIIERQAIFFCPICGMELPPSLGDAWCNELDRIGIDPLNDQIPAPYSDGSWWRAKQN